MDEEELRNMQILANNRPIEDFEGYSPNEMMYVIYDLFHQDSVVKLHKEIDYDVLNQIPFLLQVKYLMSILYEKKELKLTKNGALPVKMVSDIYNQGFIKDDMIESGISKLYKESDSSIIELTRVIPELAGLIKKRSGLLTLTKKGLDIFEKKNFAELFRLIFTSYIQKFNWSYFDGYESETAAQMGFGFSLILLDKYGDDFQPTDFYSSKYLKAFPFILEDFVDDEFYSVDKQLHNCYKVRTFERFLNYFNLIEITPKKHLRDVFQVKKSIIFNELITIEK